jgi:hypothetical protein
MTFSEAWEKGKLFLTSRTGAYRRRLGGMDVDSRMIMADLAMFCRANESTFHPDPRIAANYDGRREVFLRIAKHLHMTDEQIMKAYPPKARI